MKRYPKYKDSGVDYLGAIPDSWPISRLKHTAIINPPKASSNYTGKEEDLASFLPMENVNKDGTFINDLKMKIKDVWNGFTYFEPNDTILAKITPCFENGKGACLINLDSKIGFGSTEFHVLRAIKKISTPKFLYYITKSDQFRNTGRILMTGAAGQKRVPPDFVKNYYIGLPSIDVQEKIVQYLDHKTHLIDTLIEKKQKQIELLQEQRAAIINQAVTKGLDPNVKMKDSGIEWIGQIPEHWSIIKTKYLFGLRVEKAPEDNDFELLSIYTSIGVRPRKDLEERGNKASTTDGYFIVNRGDIIVNKLLAWMGAIGCSKYDGVTSPAYDVLRTISPLNPFYYHYLFRGGLYLTEFKRRSRGIMEMRLRLYFDEFGQILLPYPTEEEQNSIVDYIRTQVKDVKALISKQQAQIKQLQEYRTTLISEVVTGKIDVRDEAIP